MRYGRALLAGLGWAGVLRGVALCVLLFLSAFLALDGDPSGVEPREAKIVRLPAVPEAYVPRVPLARPPARLATRSGSGGGPVAPRIPRAEARRGRARTLRPPRRCRLRRPGAHLR